jgi:hypothetical protein
LGGERRAFAENYPWHMKTNAKEKRNAQARKHYK